MKFIRALFLCVSLILVACSCGAPRPTGTLLDRDSEVNHALRSTVALMKFLPIEGEWTVFCSAFYINPQGRLLTAAHCVDREDGKSPVGDVVHFARVGETDGSGDLEAGQAPLHSAKVLVFDDDLDVAVLDSREVWGAWFEPATSVRVGEPVIVVGHPVGQVWTVTEGIVSRILPKRHHIQVSATTWFGNSGGAALNREGKVLGVASRIMDHVPQFAYFVDVREIRRMLGRAGL